MKDWKLKLATILSNEELHWKTRFREKLIKEGDGNTKYFHLLANGRRHRNFIGRLSVEGQKWESTKSIIVQARCFFKNFAKPIKTELAFNWPKLRLPSSWQDEMEDPFTEQEIKEAVFCSYANGAPGPDGLPMHFYQKN